MSAIRVHNKVWWSRGVLEWNRTGQGSICSGITRSSWGYKDLGRDNVPKLGWVLGRAVVSCRKIPSILSSQEGCARLSADQGGTVDLLGLGFCATATFVGGTQRGGLLLGARRFG